ncbi:MAG: flagellar basal-body MS-ring/collar protein FliF [Mariprofundaceae bacterium]
MENETTSVPSSVPVPQDSSVSPVKANATATTNNQAGISGKLAAYPSLPELFRNPRVVMAVVGFSVLLGIIGIGYWSVQKPYQLLFNGMTQSEASQVVSILQKEHVPYRLEGANMVMVPSDRVYALRLRLAGQGITPGQGVGFEIFDKDFSFNSTDFTRQVNLQRALQGELARTIQVLPNVISARVHLVMSKDSAFLKRERKASASVMLKLVGQQSLSRETANAIQNLVAASVPNMGTDAVTIMDSAGHLLSLKHKEESSSLNLNQKLQDYQDHLEAKLEKRLTAMLEQVVGLGQAVVRVTALLNRSEIERQIEQFNPDEVVIRSENVTDEKSSSMDSGAKGVPGVASNTPGANQRGGSPVSTNGEKASRNEMLKNYEISSTKEHQVIPSGALKQLSVAVIVGGKKIKGDDDTEVFQPRGDSEIQAIRALVQRAAGFDEQRGDTIEVQSLPLINISSDDDAVALQESEQRAFILEMIRYGVIALVLLLIAWFILRPLASMMRGQSKEVEDAGAVDKEAMGYDDLKALTAAPVISPIDKVRLALDTQPERATQVLREWIQGG